MAKQKLEKNALEWAVFALSGLLVLGVVAYLAYVAATLGSSPPEVVIKIGESRPEGEYFHVPVTVHNNGDKTAEGVHIEVELQQAGETETAQFEVPFLPRHSDRKGAVLFKLDPQKGKLKARVLGYQMP